MRDGIVPPHHKRGLDMKQSFRKLLGVGAITALAMVTTHAHAENFYLNVGNNFDAFGTKVDGPNSTGSFAEMNIRYNSTTTITDSNGDGILSPGDSVLGTGGLLKIPGPAGLGNTVADNHATNFTPVASIMDPAGPALNGFPNQWLISFGWDNLAGVVNPGGGITYSSGLIHVYMADPSVFGNNALNEILQLHVTSGGNNAIGQSLNLNGWVSVLPGAGQNVFRWASDLTSWFDTLNGIDFETNQNTQPFYVNGVLANTLDPLTFYNGNRTGVLEANHDGSFSAMRVPEPGSMALLGGALMGLGALRRRRKA